MNATQTVPNHLLRKFSRKTVALATAAAVAFSGATIVATVHADSASAMMKQCWYRGWFKEDGQWYQGYFKEAC